MHQRRSTATTLGLEGIKRQLKNGRRWSRTLWIEASGRRLRLFATGVTLNQLDGNLVVPEHMQEVSRDLVAAVDEAQQVTFQPQRENDELTRALKNLEHPGRACGIGVIPWKVAWAGDSSYKTHRKSKAEKEEKFRALQEEMNRKVASLESQMVARVNVPLQLRASCTASLTLASI